MEASGRRETLLLKLSYYSFFPFLSSLGPCSKGSPGAGWSAFTSASAEAFPPPLFTVPLLLLLPTREFPPLPLLLPRQFPLFPCCTPPSLPDLMLAEKGKDKRRREKSFFAFSRTRPILLRPQACIGRGGKGRWPLGTKGEARLKQGNLILLFFFLGKTDCCFERRNL